MSRRAALFANPTAGRGLDPRFVERLVTALAPAWTVEHRVAATASEARLAARRAVEEQLEALFVLGGDGSLRNAARELVGSSTALGPLPGGTTNVIARALGLPGDPLAAARALLTAPARELDVGRAGDDLFLMQLSGGLDARVMAEVDPRWKRRFGKLAVAWTGLRVWASYRFPPLAIEVDGVAVTAAGFVLANFAEYAGSFRIVPEARPDDRRLDLLLFHGRTRGRALGFALDLALGRHARRADVAIRPAGAVRLVAPARLALQADGDAFVAAAPFEASLDDRALAVLAPPSSGG